MDNQKQQIVEKLKGANNILVTVSNNPSVDQLAACIGLTLLLNKLDKHATAVFSGNVPSTIDFLKPEETLEQNTDSLRDFIIALDKSKADKLRYKVEDKVVKIFITPYRTSISQGDLEFSQGDFNVDVVVALGVHEQRDLDQAITAHGRILHDAVVTTVNVTPDGGLGTINWHQPTASSLSEMIAALSDSLGKELLDEQTATALLTGIVAETDRFSNAKTSADTMKTSAELMAAGANQQLVANQLQEQLQAANNGQGGSPGNTGQGEPPATPAADPSKPDDGTLEITHDRTVLADQLPPSAAPPSNPASEPPADIDDLLRQISEPVTQEPASSDPNNSSRPLTMEPPSLGGTLTANAQPEELESPIDPLSLPEVEQPLLQHDAPSASEKPEPAPEPTPEAREEPVEGPTPPATPAIPPASPEDEETDEQTLSDIEQSVHSPHTEAKTSHLTDARDAVEEALKSAPAADQPPEPVQALNALPLGDTLHAAEEAAAAPFADDDMSEQGANHEVHIDAEGNFQPPAPEPIAQPPVADVHEAVPGQDLSPANNPGVMPLPPTYAPPMPPLGPPANPNGPPLNPPPFMPFTGPNDPSR